MNSNRGIVKVIASNIDVDWYSPYKNKDNNESIGTGFFINKEGYFLTCAHVVDSSIKTFFTVPAHSKDQKTARLISICYDKDIALLKAVDYVNEDFLELADSDQIIPGQLVNAVGYPLGQDRLKLTSGIISGRQGRYLQTDAPINSGNSGGPLVNEKGQVIGINTAKMASFMADNIGYATPINDYKVIEEVMFAGATQTHPSIIRKPLLICQFNNTDKYLMQYLKSPESCQNGYYIKHIYESSPLYRVGIREGDVVCRFDGLEIDNFGEASVEWSNDKVHLFDLMDRYKVGDQVEIGYWSLNQLLDSGSQEIMTRKITLDATDDLFTIRLLHPPLESIPYEILGGMIVAPLTLNHLSEMYDQDISDVNRFSLKGYLKLEKRFKKVVIITNVFPGSYLRTTNTVENGDIIESINDQCISTLEDFRQAIPKFKVVDGKKFIKLKLKNRTTVVLSLDKIIEEEYFLSDQYKYPISPLFHQLEKSNGGLPKNLATRKPGPFQEVPLVQEVALMKEVTVLPELSETESAPGTGAPHYRLIE